MQVSYAVGCWAQIQRTTKLLPDLRYSAVLDDRTGPAHRLGLQSDHPAGHVMRYAIFRGRASIILTQSPHGTPA